MPPPSHLHPPPTPSGILGTPFDSALVSPVFFFCMLPLLSLSCLSFCLLDHSSLLSGCEVICGAPTTPAVKDGCEVICGAPTTPAVKDGCEVICGAPTTPAVKDRKGEGPYFCFFPQKILPYFSLSDRLFGMALV